VFWKNLELFFAPEGRPEADVAADFFSRKKAQFSYVLASRKSA
jgi:hypothetical protein